MVERIFDSTLPLYVVPIPAHAAIAANAGTDGASSFGISPLDQDSVPGAYASSSSLMTTFLPLNFWLMASPAGISGSSSSPLGSYTTTCTRRQLSVQLERGKSDGQRWMALSITDPTDPLFYYEQRLDEEGYGRMRAEQQILVPLESFTEQLAAFLKATAPPHNNGGAAAPVMPPKMAACLATHAAGWALFQIIETSSFKHIVHLSLRVDRLSDDGMKRRLAQMAISALAEVSALKARLSETLRDTDSFTHSITAERDALRASLDGLSSSLEKLGRDGSTAQGTTTMLGPLAERIALLKDALRDRDLSMARSSELEATLRKRDDEIAVLTASVTKLRDELSRVDTLRSELARKRALLEEIESVSAEREERIVALKTELRAAKEAKIKAEEEAACNVAKISQLDTELSMKSDEALKLTEELVTFQAEVRAAKGKTRAKSAIIHSKSQELEAALSNLAEERANISLLTEALNSAQERISQLENENKDLRGRIDKYDRVSEWMRRRLGGESEVIAPPTASAFQKKTGAGGANTLADLHSMITRLGMATPGGHLSSNPVGTAISPPLQSTSSFSPVEPGDLPTPPQPSGHLI